MKHSFICSDTISVYEVIPINSILFDVHLQWILKCGWSAKNLSNWSWFSHFFPSFLTDKQLDSPKSRTTSFPLTLHWHSGGWGTLHSNNLLCLFIPRQCQWPSKSSCSYPGQQLHLSLSSIDSTPAKYRTNTEAKRIMDFLESDCRYNYERTNLCSHHRINLVGLAE